MHRIKGSSPNFVTKNKQIEVNYLTCISLNDFLITKNDPLLETM